MEVGRRVVREVRRTEDTSTRNRMILMKPTLKKVEVVYYIATSNGHLHHPHYIQLTLPPNQHLRLKDVLDRLIVLRGKAMPSLYSWSCKRSYKNGYVWNDLALNDVVSPSGGGEYVLKGSELPPPSTGKLHHLQLGNVEQFEHLQTGQESNSFLPKHQYEEENAEEYDKITHARCSRGVSTEETKDEILIKQKQITTTLTELNLDSNRFSSPPSTTSSSHSDNPTNDHTIKRFEDGDPVANEPMLSRNSMLFNLIACGGTGSFRKSTLPPGVKEPPPCTAARMSGSGSSLLKGVVCKAAKMAAEEDDHEMINYMSENPRFGNLQSEEKEYFSGSIVESITDEQRIGALPTSLQKSSSYNHERSKKSGLGELAAEEEEKQGKGVRGKCIPRKKKPTSKTSQKQH